MNDLTKVRIKGDGFKNAIAKVPTEYWALDEEDLRKISRPTNTDYALRNALWNEVRLLQGSSNPIHPERIYTGICSYTHWYNNVLNNPKKLAWILQPLQTYEKVLEPLLMKASERLYEVLDLDFRLEDGAIDRKILKMQVDIIRYLDSRLLGNPTHKEHRISLCVDSPCKVETYDTDFSQKSTDDMTEAEVEVELQKVEAELARLEISP